MLIPAFADFLWNSQTQRLHYADFREVGPSTYERPLAVSYFSTTMPPRYLNPTNYATFETAAAIEAWAKKQWPTLTFTTVAAPSSGVSFPQLLLQVENAVGKGEQFAAGQWAFTKDKNGETAAKASFDAELRAAGLIS